VKAIDTNILVFAEITSSDHNAAARRVLEQLAEGTLPWGLPWPCVYEFLRVVTHPRVFHPPMPMTRALADLQRVLASPSLVLLREGPRHAEVMARTIAESGATGNLVQDAHIAALCLENGATELISGDRDFGRFPGLRLHNPFSA
jgi:hypothetical protein